MKKIILLTLVLLMSFHFKTYSQESYGKTLNLGLGVAGYSGYYRYARSIPIINVNYEIDVLKNFTLAPFVSIYFFKDNYYRGNKNYPDRYYSYSEIVVPVGVKAYYYFEGVILCMTGITIQTGASINGRALAQTAVILDANAVTKP